MIPKGLIVSIQGYSRETTEELASEAANAGAVAIRTDKLISCRLPLIGLKKIKVSDPRSTPYITPTIEDVKAVAAWTKFIAVDCRRANGKNTSEILKYARDAGLQIIADIATVEDYLEIVENDFYPWAFATTFRVFEKRYEPDFDFYRVLFDYECYNLIAEGNISTRNHVRIIKGMGIGWYCIGQAISGIYGLTKKFTSVKVDTRGKNGV